MWPGIATAAALSTHTHHCFTCLVSWYSDAQSSTCWACGGPGHIGTLPRPCLGTPFADAAATGVAGDF